MLAQEQFARFAVEQGDATEGKLLRAEIHMSQADIAIDHPGRGVFGRQDAQLVRAAHDAGLITAKGAGTAADVAGQGVVTGRFVILSVVMIVPQGCRHAVTEFGAVLKASMGRTVKGLKDLQGFQCGHYRFSNALHPTP